MFNCGLLKILKTLSEILECIPFTNAPAQGHFIANMVMCGWWKEKDANLFQINLIDNTEQNWLCRITLNGSDNHNYGL